MVYLKEKSAQYQKKSSISLVVQQTQHPHQHFNKNYKQFME